jgi:hypothetical protein
MMPNAEPTPVPLVRELPTYEPLARHTPADEQDAFRPPRRWSSLRPVPRSSRGRVAVPARATGSPKGVPRRFGNGHPANASLATLLAKVLEALDGRRPVDQLRGMLADGVYEAALTRARAMTRARVRYRLRSLHSCRLSADLIEVSGLVEATGAVRPVHALAARFERHAGTWQCAVLRLL